MSWNCRVIEFTDPDGTITRSIHVVHYDADRKPVQYTENPVGVVWSSDEDPLHVIDQIKQALNKDVLDQSVFVDAIYEAANKMCDIVEAAGDRDDMSDVDVMSVLVKAGYRKAEKS